MSEGDTDLAEAVSGGLYPIRTVSALTGVNPVTLRAWERRHGLIRPRRTATGRRVYSRADVDRIHRILALTNQGVAIGQVAEVLDRQGEGPTDIWQRYRERMIAAIVSFDQPALEDVYDEVIALHPMDVVTRKVLVPLLHQLGRRWEAGEGRVADEHFFSVFLRNKLGARLHHLARRPDGRRLVAACLPGELHELGLLLFALAAAERGYRVLVLGASMPISELPAVVRTIGAAAVILAGSMPVSEKETFTRLARLVKSVPCPVMVGGTAAADSSDEITAAGACTLGEDFDFAATRLDQLLSTD